MKIFNPRTVITVLKHLGLGDRILAKVVDLRQRLNKPDFMSDLEGALDRANPEEIPKWLRWTATTIKGVLGDVTLTVLDKWISDHAKESAEPPAPEAPAAPAPDPA